jgi:uncharacterized protein
MRRFIPPILAAAVVVALALLAGVSLPATARGDAATPDTVTALGHGVVTVAPDAAAVTAGVHTQSPTAAGALADDARQMTAVVAALEAAGGDDLQTQQVSLYPQTNEQGRVTGYVADNSVSATTAIANAGALVDAAVKAGANTVGGPSLSVSDRDARYREALEKAVDDARRKAEALAHAGGFGVGPVSSVVEGVQQDASVVFQAVGAKRDASTPIEPGTQDVTADVTVTFRIR